MAPPDVIRIRGLNVQCIVGLYPRERTEPQLLQVDIDLGFDARPAALDERLSLTLDYAMVAAQITFVLQSGRFRLLETAAHVLACQLLAPPALGEKRAQASEARVRLTKPAALAGHAIPSLEIFRTAAEVTLSQERKSWGVVDVLHESRDAGVYRLNIAPGGTIPLHVHRRMHESEMVITEGVHCQDREIAMGTVFRWPLDAAHRYWNPTDRHQTILCVDVPRFIISDEIEVTGEPASISPVGNLLEAFQ